MKSPKVFLVVAIGVAVAGVAWIALGNLGENLVYYWTPTELRDHAEKAQGATVRLGGMVKVGSILPGDPLTFTVTDGVAETTVMATEIPPAMFREGIGVVVEGTVDPNGTFQSKRLMVKHDNSYKAPTDGKMPDQKEMFGTLSDDAEAAAVDATPVAVGGTP